MNDEKGPGEWAGDRAVARRTALCALGAAGLAALAAGEARAEDAAAQIFVALYAPGPAWVAGRPMQAQDLSAHARYIGRLRDEGSVFAGGGWADEDGGMALFLAADRAGAEALLAADPAITSGVFVAALHHWRPRFRTDAPLP